MHTRLFFLAALCLAACTDPSRDEAVIENGLKGDGVDLVLPLRDTDRAHVGYRCDAPSGCDLTLSMIVRGITVGDLPADREELFLALFADLRPIGRVKVLLDAGLKTYYQQAIGQGGYGAVRAPFDEWGHGSEVVVRFPDVMPGQYDLDFSRGVSLRACDLVLSASWSPREARDGGSTDLASQGPFDLGTTSAIDLGTDLAR